MAIGPGKYDDICTVARESAKASAAIVIILDGVSGSGFSCQCHAAMPPKRIAEMLETVAKIMRESE